MFISFDWRPHGHCTLDSYDLYNYWFVCVLSALIFVLDWLFTHRLDVLVCLLFILLCTWLPTYYTFIGMSYDTICDTICRDNNTRYVSRIDKFGLDTQVERKGDAHSTNVHAHREGHLFWCNCKYNLHLKKKKEIFEFWWEIIIPM